MKAQIKRFACMLALTVLELRHDYLKRSWRPTYARARALYRNRVRMEAVRQAGGL